MRSNSEKPSGQWAVTVPPDDENIDLLATGGAVGGIGRENALELAGQALETLSEIGSIGLRAWQAVCTEKLIQ